MALGVEVGLVPGDFVLDGNQLPLPLSQRRGQSPQFSANVYCGQTTACIKMPLGMDVGLSQGDFVLDGYPVPSNFCPMFIIVIVISLEHCTMHSRYWFVQVQVLVFYAFYFQKKSLIVLSLFRYAQLHDIAPIAEVGVAN